jgi:hypothetical protein
MTESNKETLIHFGKVVALFLLGMIAIITSAGVWNGVHAGAIGSFYGWVAGLNLVAEGFGIWSLWKFLFKKKEEAVKVEEPKPVKKAKAKKTNVSID